ncbi:MAG: M23 family metallopeptidase [Thermodesulfobacteriota bacterium]
MRALLAAFLALLLWPVLASAASLSVEPARLALGQPGLVRLCLKRPAQQVRAELRGRSTALDQGRDGCWYGVAAADLQDQAGQAVLRARVDGRQVAVAELTLYRADRGIRRITVDPKFLKLSPEALARHRRERALILAVVGSFTAQRLWAGGFALPLHSQVVSAFGRRSIVNGQERSPHSGVDLRGALGTPVPAAADGTVALVIDAYFSGVTILIDHGQGLITRYLHLSQALVRKGQKVKRGQIIGKVGASGRVTGPHLDFGVKLAGAAVDPLAWIEVSRRLAQRLGE